MQRITRDQARKFAFDWRDEPLLRVQPGESFEIETWDASSGFFKTPSDKAIPANRPGFDSHPPLANPIGGPVYIEGAESTRWPELSSQYTTKIFKHSPGPSGTMRDGTMQFNDEIAWPITPFIGTIGVAPEREVTTSIDGQGPWGGNLDIRDVTVGNRIHLPVSHAGALFYLGDVHASQGDTEYTGTAAETCATVRVRLELVKQKRLPFMRIEKPDSIISVHAARPLELAVDTATQHLMAWMIDEYGMSPTDAYCLVSTCPNFRINIYQMVNMGKLSFVAGAEMTRNILGKT